jgi:uncharacterized protein (DUF2147 family)
MLAGGLISLPLLAQTISPVGDWVQFNDVTGKPHSIIRIYQSKGKLYGKIVKGIQDGDQPLEEFCSHCPGDLHNKPMLGLRIMTDFTKTDDLAWGDGQILDPDTGKTYSCKLTLDPSGKTLNVRGYVGFSMFGRTQVWTRK